MNWKVKSAIQNAISLLPETITQPTYLWLQRSFGTLGNFNPVAKLGVGIETWKRIKATGIDPSGKTFLEVGTGRTPLVPLAYWLLGSAETITLDKNPYMNLQIIKDNITDISAREDEVRNMFGSELIESRLKKLLNLSRVDNSDPRRLLDMANIHYISPADASKTGLPESSIDFHTSNNVLEHIPPESLKDIIREGRRIIKPKGLMAHRIDYSDHFSHSDRTISSINFLQYSDRAWRVYAGNNYMYMNRLRHDDYLEIFDAEDMQLIEEERFVDQRVESILANNEIRLDKKFQHKSKSILKISAAWFILSK